MDISTFTYKVFPSNFCCSSSKFSTVAAGLNHVFETRDELETYMLITIHTCL